MKLSELVKIRKQTLLNLSGQMDEAIAYGDDTWSLRNNRTRVLLSIKAFEAWIAAFGDREATDLEVGE